MPRRELGMAGCNSGSCDSMASTASNHSQHSDNSYDYLSVEEKECLMFLEETIGSLDAEADSGVSMNENNYMEPSKLPGTWPKRDSITQGLENGAPPLQNTAEQKSGKTPSAFPKSASAVVPSSGYSSLPRITTAANGASDSKAAVHAVKDPQSSQEMAREDRLDQPGIRSQMKSLESLLIQPPDRFQDELVSQEWSHSNRSDDKRETAKETKTWMSWGQPEKSTLEEAPQDPDTKRGPPTAPKPRKLPPNIILKTSKNSPVALSTEPNQKVKASPPSLASDTTAEKVNSGHLDPKEREKARQEALEKLGLSQDRKEPSVHLQPTARPQPKEVPCPIPAEPEAGDEAVERSVPGVRQMPFKSNTLERSGVGLSSYMASTKEQSVKTSSSLGKMSFIERLAPSFLRSSRPRPVSPEMGKDFAGLKEPEQVEQDKSSKRRSHPLQSFPRPPRSSVSVKISPKGATDENRREALKKLGLLKE